jgi:hypothetical protein
MSSSYLLKSGLLLHLAGITLLVGTTVTSFSTYRLVWHSLVHERSKTLLLIQSTLRLRLLQIIAVVLVLAGGILMLSVYRDAVTHQTWFKLKMVTVILVILNFFVVGRPAAARLRIWLQKNQAGADPAILNGIKSKMNFYHRLQLLLFLILFVLSAFRGG